MVEMCSLLGSRSQQQPHSARLRPWFIALLFARFFAEAADQVVSSQS